MILQLATISQLVIESSLNEGLCVFDVAEARVREEYHFSLVDRNREANLFGSAVPTFAHDDGVDDAEHVEFTDEVRDAPLREDVGVEFLAEALVDVEHLAGVDVVDAVLLEKNDREEDDLALGRERPDHLDDAVEFDLVLCLPDVCLFDGVGLTPFGEFACGSEQVERAAGVAVFLCGERRTERDDVVGERVSLERDVRAVLEDVAELVGVVRREDDLLFAETRLHARVEEVGELQVVRDPHDGDTRVVEFGVHPREVV